VRVVTRAADPLAERGHVDGGTHREHRQRHPQPAPGSGMLHGREDSEPTRAGKLGVLDGALNRA
jgi:hypothetical protein